MKFVRLTSAKFDRDKKTWIANGPVVVNLARACYIDHSYDKGAVQITFADGEQGTFVSVMETMDQIADKLS